MLKVEGIGYDIGAQQAIRKGYCKQMNRGEGGEGGISNPKPKNNDNIELFYLKF
jgi:hypothetical protein